MMSATFNRRRLLRATSAGAALLPFVPLLDRDAHAQASIKRLIVFFSSNGTIHEKWLPTMSNGSLVMSDILKPLEPYKSDALVIDGLGYNSPGWAGHEVGVVLTGAKAQRADGNNNLATGISIDQAVANAIGSTTKLKSLECGIDVDPIENTFCSLSYTGSLQPVRAQNSPAQIFTRAFSGLTPPSNSSQTAALEQARLDGKSVIDFVMGDLAALRPKLGTDEQRKVDAHLEGIRGIEKTLTTAAPSGSACKLPAKPGTLDFGANDNIPVVGRLQMDLLVMALACDLTRVGTIQYGRGGANHRFTWLGPDFTTTADERGDGTSGIHGLAHNEANANARAKLVRIHAWYASELAYLMSRLKAIPDGNGTLADGTLVVWCNELGNGTHSLKKAPWVLLGSARGALKTGRVLSFPGQSHTKLLVSIAQAMGLNVTSFGDPALGTGPLPGLTG